MNIAVAGWTRARRALPQALQAAALVGLLTVGVKFSGMIRDAVLAHQFGTGDEIEAFLAAWAIPQFLTVIAGSALAGVLVPQRAAAAARCGEGEARRFSREMLLVSAIGLLVLTLLLVPARDALLPLVTASFSPEKLALTERLWLILLPAISLSAMASVWQGLLNTKERFGLAAVSPIVVAVTTIGVLLLFPSAGIDAVAVGLVVGTAIQGALLLWGLRRAGFDVFPGWYGGTAETRIAVRHLAPFLANATLFGSLGVVDQAMAATLGPGNVAILNYSNKLVLPILGIGSTSLATVLYPMFSRLAAEREWRQLQQSARRYVTLVLAVTIPATVVLVMLSPWLVEIIFQRGAFSEADAQAVARVQALYLLMIPAYTAAELLSRIINALGATSYMAITSAGIFLFNFIADYVLKEWIGLEGIALATVLNFSFSVIVNIYLVRRLLRQRIAMSEGGTG